MMTDQITIDELKVFLGTGLKVNLDGIIFELEGIHMASDQQKPYAIVGNESVLFSRYKPIVKPLHKITLSHLKESDLDRYDKTTTGNLKSAINSLKYNARNGYLELIESLYLASKHYDIFGWLDRVDADGNPLAIEKD